MIALKTQGDTPEQAAAKLRNAGNAIRPDGGLIDVMTLGISKLQRFVVGNIQVGRKRGNSNQGGRTKNSIFAQVESGGNGVVAMLGATTRHAPYVGHIPRRSSRQFFDHAKNKEVPNVIEMMGIEVIARVEEPFE